MCGNGISSIYGAALPGSVHICSFPLQNSYLQDTWKMEGEFCIFGYFLIHSKVVVVGTPLPLTSVSIFYNNGWSLVSVVVWCHQIL